MRHRCRDEIILSPGSRSETHRVRPGDGDGNLLRDINYV